MKKTAFLLLIAICLSLFSCITSNEPAPGENKKYTVSFQTNGGTEVAELTVEKLQTAPTTTKEGYAFCGWFLDKALKTPAAYPLQPDRNLTLYAKWTEDSAQIVLNDASVQFSVDDEYAYKAEYVIIPQELDLEALAAQGYSLKVDVTYEVYYEKNYDMAFDLGYMGAPDHDVSLVDNYDEGELKENLPTSTEAQTESISTVVSVSDMLKDSLRLKLMTYNLQNVVHFQNIVVNFTCVKINPAET